MCELNLKPKFRPLVAQLYDEVSLKARACLTARAPAGLDSTAV